MKVQKLKTKCLSEFYKFRYLTSLGTIFNYFVTNKINEKNVPAVVQTLNKFDTCYERLNNIEKQKDPTREIIYDWSYVFKSVLFYSYGEIDKAKFFLETVDRGQMDKRLPQKYLKEDVEVVKTFAQISADVLSLIYKNRETMLKNKNRDEYFAISAEVGEQCMELKKQIKSSALDKRVKDIFDFFLDIERNYFIYILNKTQISQKIPASRFDYLKAVIKEKNYILHKFYSPEFLKSINLIRIEPTVTNLILFDK